MLRSRSVPSKYVLDTDRKVATHWDTTEKVEAA